MQSQIEQIRKVSKSKLHKLLMSGYSVSKVLQTFGLAINNPLARKTLKERIECFGLQHYHKRNDHNRKYTVDQLKAAVDTAECWSDIYRALGISISNHNKKCVLRIAGENNIEVPNFYIDSIKHTFGRGKKLWTFAEIFCTNSQYARSALRTAVIRFGVLEYCCTHCQNKGHWFGNNLVLEIDHINGDTSDNRISNLRWLCPNCHSITPTFKGKKRVPKTTVSIETMSVN